MKKSDITITLKPELREKLNDWAKRIPETGQAGIAWKETSLWQAVRFLTLSPQEHQYRLDLESFRLRMQMITGCEREWPQQLIDEATRAAHEMTASNSAVVRVILQRMLDMAARGDVAGQIMEWVKACPRELWMQYQAEEIMPGLYPGGPGRLTQG